MFDKIAVVAPLLALVATACSTAPATPTPDASTGGSMVTPSCFAGPPDAACSGAEGTGCFGNVCLACGAGVWAIDLVQCRCMSVWVCPTTAPCDPNSRRFLDAKCTEPVPFDAGPEVG